MMRKKKSFIPALRKAAAGILLLVILLSCAACAKDGGDSTLQPTDSQGQEHPNEGDLSDYYSGPDNREYFDIPAYIQKSSFVGEKVTVAMIRNGAWNLPPASGRYLPVRVYLRAGGDEVSLLLQSGGNGKGQPCVPGRPGSSGCLCGGKDLSLAGC